jgi:hypothetical protein
MPYQTRLFGGYRPDQRFTPEERESFRQGIAWERKRSEQRQREIVDFYERQINRLLNRQPNAWRTARRWNYWSNPADSILRFALMVMGMAVTLAALRIVDGF